MNRDGGWGGGERGGESIVCYLKVDPNEVPLCILELYIQKVEQHFIKYSVVSDVTVFYLVLKLQFCLMDQPAIQFCKTSHCPEGLPGQSTQNSL